MYMAMTGTFLQRDPVSSNGVDLLYSDEYVADRMRSQSQQLTKKNEQANLYAYVRNNPTNYVDPLGLQETPGSGGFFNSLGSSFYSMGQTYYAIGQYGLGNSAGANQTLLNAYGNSALGQAEAIGPGTYNATATSLGFATAATAAALAVGGAEVALLGNQSAAEFNVLSSGNVAKVISRPFKCGFRIDPAHHGKPWGHSHWWWWK